MSKLKIAVLDTAWPQPAGEADPEFEELLSRFDDIVTLLNPHLADYKLGPADEHGGYVLSCLLCPLDHTSEGYRFGGSVSLADQVEVRLIQTLPGGKYTQSYAESIAMYAWAWEQAADWIGSSPGIVNCSWGAPDMDLDVGGSTSQAHYQALAEAMQPMYNMAVAFLGTCKNSRIVAASGNHGYQYGSGDTILPDADQDVAFPWRLAPGVSPDNENPRMWAIGAHGPRWKLAPFSGDGPQVVLCAQGQGVRALGPSGWRYLDGTSFAAPRVAGLLAREMTGEGEDPGGNIAAINVIGDAEHNHAKHDGQQQQLDLGLHCWAHGYGTMERPYRRACIDSASEPAGWVMATTAWMRRRVRDV